MADDTEELLRQLADVQSQLAFQEDTVSALNEAVARQQQEIMVLHRQLALLKQRQDEQSARLVPESPVAEEEKPPHY